MVAKTTKNLNIKPTNHFVCKEKELRGGRIGSNYHNEIWYMQSESKQHEVKTVLAHHVNSYYMFHVFHKSGHPFLFAVSSPNLDRFSKFLHC